VAYLNGSKVLTTGSALTFSGSTLANGGAADGTNAITATGNTVGGFIALRPDGTNGQAIRIGGSGASADVLRFLATADTEYMRLNSSGLEVKQSQLIGYSSFAGIGSNGLAVLGNVGIGTNAPATKLDVNSTAAAVMRLTRNGGTAANTALQYFNGTNSWYAGMSAFGLYSIGYNDAALDSGQLRLDSSGNLGLGVTPKTDWSTDYKAMQFGGSGALSSLTSTSLNFTVLATNQYINSAGTSKFINDGYAPRYLLRGDTGEHYWYTTNTSTAGQNVANTQAMTLDSSGNLVVGTTGTAQGRVHAHATTNAQFVATDATLGTTYGGVFRGYGVGGQGGNAELGVLDNGSYTKAIKILDNATGILFFAGVTNAGSTERARITSGGDFQTSSGGSVQVGGTAARATTAGTNRVDIFDGTAPVGTLANGVSFYSTAGEARVMDAAGNATLLSPHDTETNEWIFHSKHTPTGKVLRIDVERLLRFVNAHFGLDAVKEFVEE
jgi:hypothetical protein